MSGRGSPCANSRARRANHASLYLFGSAGTCPQGQNMVGISMGWARSPRARARKVKAAGPSDMLRHADAVRAGHLGDRNMGTCGRIEIDVVGADAGREGQLQFLGLGY